MSVSVRIFDGPLAKAGDEELAGAGAVVTFQGFVREDEGGRMIDAIDYQTYEPMVQTMISRIGEDLVERHRLVAIRVEHSRGRVGVGEVSFRLLVAAVHRKEALAAMDEFIDRLKRDVPIWKRPVWRGGVG